MLTNDMEHVMKHVMKLPSKGQFSIWVDNDLRYIYPREPYHIQILSRVLDHVADLKPSTEGANRLQLIIPSAPSIAN